MPPASNVHPGLSGVLDSVAAKIRRFRTKDIGEQNTKSAFIEPVLAALGWDVHDPDEVYKEYKPKKRYKPMDYALRILNEPRLFVEAKGLGERLSDFKWVTQVQNCSNAAGVKWCVLTDGDEYRIYNALAEVNVEAKLFCSVKVTQDDRDELVRVLSLLSRDQLDGYLLDQYWTAYHVDQLVKGALEPLVADEADALVRAIRGKESRLAPKEVKASLRHLNLPVGVKAVAAGLKEGMESSR